MLAQMQTLGLAADDVDYQKSGIVFLHGEQLSNLDQEGKVCFRFWRGDRSVIVFLERGLLPDEAAQRLIAAIPTVNAELDRACER